MENRINTLKRYYTSAAIVLLNLCAAFIVLNLLALASTVALGLLWPRTNVVEERHGETLAAVYPGWKAEDVDALLDETWGRGVEFEPYTMFKEPVSKGRFVNVDAAGFRVSKDQGPWPPAPDAYNVFLFGGSTTFSYGLPDNETLPSYLQRAMSTRGGRPVRVYNFGVGAFQSSQERVLFQRLLMRDFRPQMAIFVDGLNEFAFPREPLGTVELRRLVDDPPVKRFVWLSSSISRRLPLVRFIDEIERRVAGNPDEQPIVVREDDETKELLAWVFRRYLANKQLIQASADTYGIPTVFVWQPIPFYKYDSKYHPFRSNDNRYAALGYQRFRERIPADIGKNFLWLADMQESMTRRLYVDSVHYTAEMNGLLANEIVKRMTERGLFGSGAKAERRQSQNTIAFR